MSHKELIIDTGFFLALLLKTDHLHKKALELRKTIEHRKWITTWPVLTEVFHLLSSRKSAHLIEALLNFHDKGGFKIYDLSPTHIPKIISLIEKYKQLPMDLADASLVIVAEELGHGDIVSTDSRDFKSYRWKSHKPFNNLLVY